MFEDAFVGVGLRFSGDTSGPDEPGGLVLFAEFVVGRGATGFEGGRGGEVEEEEGEEEDEGEGFKGEHGDVCGEFLSDPADQERMCVRVIKSDSESRRVGFFL